MEIQRTNGRPKRIEGFGAVFFDPNDAKGTSYTVPGAGFIERFHPNAFDSSLESNQPIVSYYNHSSDRKLGETTGGSLEVTRNERGVQFSIPIVSGDDDHNYVVGKISSGIVRGSSIHALIKDYHESRERGHKVVTITEATLFEIGPVAQPAYTGTSAVLRSDDFFRHVLEDRSRSQRSRIFRGVTFNDRI